MILLYFRLVLRGIYWLFVTLLTLLLIALEIFSPNRGALSPIVFPLFLSIIYIFGSDLRNDWRQRKAAKTGNTKQRNTSSLSAIRVRLILRGVLLVGTLGWALYAPFDTQGASLNDSFNPTFAYLFYISVIYLLWHDELREVSIVRAHTAATDSSKA